MKKYANKVKDLQKKIDAANAVLNSEPCSMENIFGTLDEETLNTWDLKQYIWLKIHRDDYETLKELNGMTIETTVFLDSGKKDHVKFDSHFCFGGVLLGLKNGDFYVGTDKFVLRDLALVLGALEYLNLDFDEQLMPERKVMLDYDALGL